MLFLEQESKKSEKHGLVERQCCDFCGRKLAVEGTALSERRRYCSRSCQSRASRGRVQARMQVPFSKRYATKLKFSCQLYFN